MPKRSADAASAPACPSSPCWSSLACAGLTWVQLGTWRDAIALWEHAIQVEPSDPVGHARLGAEYLERGLTEKAITHYERAAELSPESPGYLYDLGLVYLVNGETQKALRAFSEVERMKPDWGNLHHKLALLYVVSPERDLDALLRHVRLALGQGAVHAEVMALHAYIEHELGHTEEAAREYQKSLALNPDWPELANAQASTQLAGLQPSAYQIRLALYLARQCCQAVDYRRIDFLQTLAAAERAAGHRPEAIKALRKAIALASEKGDMKQKQALEKQLERDEKGGP